MNWLGEGSLTDRFNKQVLKVPRRAAWLLHALILYCLTGGFAGGFALANRIFSSLKSLKIGEKPTYGDAFDVLRNFGYTIAWFFLCLMAAWAYNVLHHRYIISEISPGHTSADERKRFLLEGIQEAGVESVHKYEKDVPTRQQKYADSIRSAAGMTKQIRLLTIAGFEYIGRGPDSLLYDVIKQHPNIDVEVIILDENCTEGKLVVADRTSKLHLRDENYDEKSLCEHIQKTSECLKKLRLSGRSGKFEIRHIGTNPIFRMLIFDEEMWVSAYEQNVHGHESKLFRIMRSANASWFMAFESFYKDAKARSKETV